MKKTIFFLKNIIKNIKQALFYVVDRMIFDNLKINVIFKQDKYLISDNFDMQILLTILILIASLKLAWIILSLFFLDEIKAVRKSDPAARGFFSYFEIIFTYSGYSAILFHKVAYILYKMRIPFIPRFISQMARFFTGIEIHQAAKIGKSLFIDHGSGVVIGETAEIGDNVVIYQGVTLGGTGKETGKRHPTIKDNVFIGAGAKILGNITIGNNVRVGANSVVLRCVADNSTVVGVPGNIVRKDNKVVKTENPLADPIIDRIKELEDRVNHYEDAIKDFDRLIELDPTSSSTYISRANAFYHIGEYEKAITDYTKAIELNPDNTDAHNSLEQAKYRLSIK